MEFHMKWIFIIFTLLLLNGCANSSSEGNKPKSVMASVGIVNHTDRYIYSASINGEGGANMSEYGAGIANVCCALLSEQWYPGLMANVRITYAKGRELTTITKLVEVDSYSQPGSIYIHIFPNDEIRVVVTRYGGSSTNHPIPAPVKPAGWKRSE